MTDQPAPRSRRICFMWSVALGVLVAAGLFFWFAVRPTIEVRAVVRRTGRARLSEQDFLRLGGEEAMAGRLSRYLRLPDWIAPEKETAVRMLWMCDSSHAMPVLVEAIDRNAPENLELAITALEVAEVLAGVDFGTRIGQSTLLTPESAGSPLRRDLDYEKGARASIDACLDWWNREGRAKYGRGGE